MGQVRTAFGGLESNENVAGVTLSFMDMGTGRARVKAALKEDLYYKVLSELTGFSLKNDEDLINKMKELAITGKKYKKVEAALNEVERSGYGIVMPDSEDLTLEEPEIVRQPGGFGLRLRAGAPSIHMIKADVETEINPIVGSEQQSEELAANLKRQIVQPFLCGKRNGCRFSEDEQTGQGPFHGVPVGGSVPRLGLQPRLQIAEGFRFGV